MFSKLFVMGLAALSVAPAVVSVPVALFESNKMELAKDLHNFHARHTHKGKHHAASKHHTASTPSKLSVTSTGGNYTSGTIVSGFAAANTTADDCSDNNDAATPNAQPATTVSNSTAAASTPADDEGCDGEDGADTSPEDAGAQNDTSDDCSGDSNDSTPAAPATNMGYGSSASSSASASATVAAATLNPTTTTTATTTSTTSASTPSSTPQKTTPTVANVASGGAKYTGKATFYTQNGVAGACGQKHPDSALIGAMNKSMYESPMKGSVSSWCGKSVKITNTDNGKSVTVLIADECPDCAHGSIDMSTGAFNKIGNPATGVLPISWTVV
ncbi:hypothetical protein FRB94_011001 [Tulasnella sp. JGI-2019a]|nr:hypothetical protein FRB93_000572 [Tulasnella sp. JGI-2019a]KAG9010024.1 hypothetical protein FRB94_011001 [Tulasnella sp. JGI-2019a]